MVKGDVTDAELKGEASELRMRRSMSSRNEAEARS